jgi:hypothetical protein
MAWLSAGAVRSAAAALAAMIVMRKFRCMVNLQLEESSSGSFVKQAWRSGVNKLVLHAIYLVVNLFWAVVAGRAEAADVEIESPPFDPLFRSDLAVACDNPVERAAHRRRIVCESVGQN